jgi:regulatory protein YycI of two-component signal transduction system YycFG
MTKTILIILFLSLDIVILFHLLRYFGFWKYNSETDEEYNNLLSKPYNRMSKLRISIAFIIVTYFLIQSFSFPN